MSTMYTKSTPRETLEYFLKRTGRSTRPRGIEALAWVHVLTGKMLVRAGHTRQGGSTSRCPRNTISIHPTRHTISLRLFFRRIFPAVLAVLKNRMLGDVRNMIKVLFVYTHTVLGGGETMLMHTISGLDRKRISPVAVISPKTRSRGQARAHRGPPF